MIVKFRDAARDLVSSVPLPLHDRLPDDLAQLPCLVLGRVDVDDSSTAAVAELSLDVWLIGRRTGVDDPYGELDTLADDLLDALGGWRGASASNAQQLIATSVRARTLDVAQQSYPAYSITVEASATTC